jgi:hypothetical protein
MLADLCDIDLYCVWKAEDWKPEFRVGDDVSWDDGKDINKVFEKHFYLNRKAKLVHAKDLESLFIDKIWFKISFILSLIIPNILLGSIFYLILFPIALLSRLFGNKDPLNLKNSLKTLFINKNTNFKAKSFEQPW